MNFGGLTTSAFSDRLSLVLILIIGLGIGTLILEAGLYWFFSKVLKTTHALAFTLLAPALIALALFTVYPLLYNIQLAFSDLRLRTIPCYTPPDTSTAPCPLAQIDAGVKAQVALHNLVLYAEPGDDSPTTGQVASGATITVLQQGKAASASAATSGGAGTGSSGGIDLGGAALPGQGQNSNSSGNSSGAASKPPDDRNWWQIKTDSGQQGWVPETVNDKPALTRQPILYSLDYGLQNFRDVFFDVDAKTGQITGWGRLLRTEGSTFPVLLARTALWTVLNVILHLVIGFGLALLMNGKLRFKGIYRGIILIPWAIPQVIAALTWKNEFQAQYGFVNSVLGQFGIAPVSWLTQPVPAFIAVVFVNVWLGVPFYMVVLTGGLGSISREYYEAAEIDGANTIQRFRAITVPLIRPIAIPIITLDAIWTFNMFNVIYLVTEGEPNESTNILVTALYNAAFGRNGTFRLGFAAAFSILIFLLLLGLATFWVTSTGALKGVYE
jgi:arabinogalactan oligomer/maltooligosaccharide transport system permease protein